MEKSLLLSPPSPSRLRSLCALVAASWTILTVACSPAAPGPATQPSSTLSPVASQATSARPATPTATPAATVDPLAARTEAEISVDGGPDFPIAAFDSLWFLTPDSDEPSITRLDPDTYEIVASVPVGTRLCQALGESEDAIWACTRGGVIRVDPETNEVAAKVEFPTAEFFGYLPLGAGSLWALSGEVTRMDTLVRLDPEANSVVATFPLGFDAEWLSYGEDAVWLTDTVGGSLWRFDPESEALTEQVTGLPAPGASAVGAGSVWLTVNATRDSPPGPNDATIVRVDPATGEIEAEFATGGSMFESSIYATDEAVWVRAITPFVTRIDPRTNEVVDTINANRPGGSITLAYGSIWATSVELNRVWRLTP